jgi:uncharacterized protein (DUF1330 family)
MKANYKLAIALFAGVAVGAAAVTGLKAQSKPPAYIVTEFEITGDPAVLQRDYAAHVQATVEPFGGRYLARGPGRIIGVEGEPPKGRVVIAVFDNIEKAQAWRQSPEYLKIFPVRQKLTKSRQYIVEGVSN